MELIVSIKKLEISNLCFKYFSYKSIKIKDIQTHSKQIPTKYSAKVDVINIQNPKNFEI